MTERDPQVVSARRALLDALDALGPHRDAVILVGAQAIYLHTGSADLRVFTVKVAGPAALLIAKAHKVAERIDSPKRRDAKDAHDIYRLLRAVGTEELAVPLTLLATDPIVGGVTRTGVGYIGTLFAAGEGAPGSMLAGQAEELVGDPVQVALAVSLLAQDLISALAQSA